MNDLDQERRAVGPRAFVRRLWWEIKSGSWGLLLLLAAHQAVVAVTLGINTYLLDTVEVLPVPGQTVWPIVFALGALGAFDIYHRRFRSRVDLAQGLMLMAYGSRALGVFLVGFTDRWSVNIAVGVVTWVALFIATQRAWTEARSAL